MVLFLLIPFLSAIAHIVERTHPWFIGFGTFYYFSWLLCVAIDQIERQIDQPNGSRDKNTNINEAGLILILVGSGLSLLCYPFNPKYEYRGSIGGCLIFLIDLAGCILFFQYYHAFPGVIGPINRAPYLTSFNEIRLGTQALYAGILFLLGVYGSRSAQFVFSFIAGLLLELLAYTIVVPNDDGDKDQKRAAGALCFISIIFMSTCMSFFTAKNNDLKEEPVAFVA